MGPYLLSSTNPRKWDTRHWMDEAGSVKGSPMRRMNPVSMLKPVALPKHHLGAILAGPSPFNLDKLRLC